MKLPPPRALVGAFAFAGYLGAAFGVENLYPISTFEMYAGAPPSHAPTRVIARDAARTAHEVDEFVGWRCEGPVPLDGTSCVNEWPYASTAYLDRAAADWVADHPGDGAEPVEIVRRVYRLTDEGGPPQVHDCLLRRCRAGRR
ncbi:MAG TPA: hypothetical protein VN903_01295 [Polyangia bacterium]|jgi:hypothetical protein|nr:hypothetical protein [Polyangia bacterium]